MLDANGVIQMINQKTSILLSNIYSTIIKKQFTTFLTEDSKIEWQHTWEFLKKKDFYDTSLELTFITKEKLLLPNHCHITTFKGDNEAQRKTLITVIHHSKDYLELEKELKQSVFKFNNNQGKSLPNSTSKSKKRKLRLSYSDIKKIRDGHNIIINNLENELPSIKDFALQLGTNEFKLKYGFKELYGISVYRFLIRERLRKAKMLIQHSDFSLKSIAHMVGFKSIPHFSRTFKKTYGYTPSSLRKKSLNVDK